MLVNILVKIYIDQINQIYIGQIYIDQIYQIYIDQYIGQKLLVPPMESY